MSASPPPSAGMPFSRELRCRLEVTGFFVMLFFFRLFGIETASAMGAWLGRTVIARTGASKLARQNLIAAYPEMGEAEREALLRAMWDNLGRVVAEYGHLDKIHLKGPKPRIEVVGLENFAAAQARGKGVLLISGHFANWEIMASGAVDWGTKGATVVRPANNPYVNRWLHKMRTRNWTPELISKGAAGTRRIFTILRKGEGICMLVDQRTSEGIPAPFFGRDALTTPVPAALALKLGAAVLPISNERLPGARFRMRIHPIIEPPAAGSYEDRLVALTAAINAFIEERVRERPEQWLWIHRRWVESNAPLRKRAYALSLGRNGATSATSNRV